MSLQVGKSVPQVTLKVIRDDRIQDVSYDEIFKGKTVALFAVPGAFTPTCNNIHLPSFLNVAQDLKSKGVDAIYCVAVNDPFVLEAWKKNAGIDDEITMLSDGNCDFTRQAGMDFDARGVGLGWRSKRYSLLAKDGVVMLLNVEDSPGECQVSNGKSLLDQV